MPAGELLPQVEVAPPNPVDVMRGLLQHLNYLIPQLIGAALVRIHGEDPLIPRLGDRGIPLSRDRRPGSLQDASTSLAGESYRLVLRSGIGYENLVHPIQAAEAVEDLIRLVQGGYDDCQRDHRAGHDLQAGLTATTINVRPKRSARDSMCVEISSLDWACRGSDSRRSAERVAAQTRGKLH